MSGGKKIIDGLQDAVRGNFARVTIQGQVWIRHDAGSPEHQLSTARGKVAELTERVDMLEAEVRDLRQRLIGGVAGVLAGNVRASQLKRWAEANDIWLRETGPKIASYHKPDDL